MKTGSKFILLLVIFSVLIIACKSRAKQESQSSAEYYTPKYAKGFSIKTEGVNKLIEVKNPWQGANVSYNYILTNNPSPSAFNEIQYPVQRAICMSSTHIAFIDKIGEINSIVGVSGIKYIFNEEIILREKQFLIEDVGSTNNIFYEKIIAAQPDVVFAYGVENEFSIIEEKLKELGIKTVYIGDYLEDSPLGKTEWLIPIATFFNKEKEAISIFEEIEKEYKATAQLCGNIEEKPKVIFNMPFNGIWYMPGGENYMSKFTSDAGALYILRDNKKRASTNYSIEDAYILALDADFWILSDYSKSLADVATSDPRFKSIPAFRNKKIYNCSKRLNENGGNDFWESGVINPHLILKDFIKIYHPELLPEHNSFYYQQLY